MVKVAICGGGVIGTCVAHYLLENGINSTIIEGSSTACAASGKAGGFLARDWCCGSALEQFAKISFNLHRELAIKLDGKSKYDYRPLEAYSLNLCEGASSGNSCHEWLNGSNVVADSLKLIGSTDTIAQLHPFKFVETLLNYNVSQGLNVMEGAAVSGILQSNNKLTGLTLSSGDTLECDAAVLTMGPWTGIAADWASGLPSIYGQKAHSITIKPYKEIPAEAIFTEFGEYSPEIYPRPDGEVYICGMAENRKPSSALPPPQSVVPTEGSCQKIKEMSNSVSSFLKDGEVSCGQACYLPLTHDGLPLIGRVPGVRGLFSGAGHGCWGILSAPATGKALAELIAGKETDIDIIAFRLDRF
ncbi:uncharacterized protein LOC143468523 [Clavelina lepadiformis]